MKSVIPKLFAREGNTYFNCRYTQIYSYLKARALPIQLLLYRCLENPRKIYTQQILENKTQWQSSFDVFLKEDLAHIGLVMHEERGVSFDRLRDIFNVVSSNNEILFISTNLYYLPHNDYYQRRQGKHWVMFTGLDDISNKSVIIDEKFTSFVSYEYSSEVLESTFSNSARRVIYFSSTNNDYNGLKERYLQFFNDFDPDFDCLFGQIIPLMKEQHESSSEDQTNSDGIYQAMNVLAGSIHMFTVFLEYIRASQSVISNLTEMKKNIENISTITKKFALSKRVNFEYLEAKINAIRTAFNDTVAFLKSPGFQENIREISFDLLIEDDRNQTNGSLLSEAAATEQTASCFQYPLDLNSLYNNQAFGSKESNADFTGGGEFFLLEDPSELINSVVSIQTNKFLIAHSLGLTNDNISCSEQAIHVDPHHYNGLYILGCGEWGDASTEIHLQYADGTNRQLPIRLTDWAWEPKYGEKKVYSTAIHRRKKVDFVPETGSLFAALFPIQDDKKLTSLTLPYFPNMHIFAITLTSADKL